MQWIFYPFFNKKKFKNFIDKKYYNLPTKTIKKKQKKHTRKDK